MGHCVEALIASEGPLRNGLSGLRHAIVIPLRQGLALVPVTEEFHDEVASQITAAEASLGGEFWLLSPNLVELARRISDSTPVAYIQTDYFGGRGTQAAAVWSQGRIIFGPEKTGDGVPLESGSINRALWVLGVRLVHGRPIDRALKALGVRTRWPLDEFDAIGLGRYRSNEDWIEGSSE